MDSVVQPVVKDEIAQFRSVRPRPVPIPIIIQSLRLFHEQLRDDCLMDEVVCHLSATIQTLLVLQSLAMEAVMEEDGRSL